MGQTLREIAQSLKEADKKVQLIYAFNGIGKTRLSREFKELISPKVIDVEEQEELKPKILYYNAFTEDLFYWDNDLDRKLKIQPNNFTDWVLREQGQESNITRNFQRYTNDKLTPHFDENFTEVRFSFERGDDSGSDFVKISKGEESCFIWSIFYSLLKETIEELIPLGEAQEELKSLEKIVKSKERDVKKLAKKRGDEEHRKRIEILKKEAEVTSIEVDIAKEKLKSFSGLFDNLEYVFIDDPVSSLDDDHLIELAVDIAELVKSSNTQLKFIITTHNPLFYNVLFNEFNSKDPRYNFNVKHSEKKRLEKLDDNTYLLHESNNSPFSYHLFLLSELEKAIEFDDIQKYHFNFLRNILEKTSTFLGYTRWEKLLPDKTEEARKSYHERILDLCSHSKHSGEEVPDVDADAKKVLTFLVKEIRETYRFRSNSVNDKKK